METPADKSRLNTMCVSNSGSEPFSVVGKGELLTLHIIEDE